MAAHVKAIKNSGGKVFYYVRTAYRDENKKPTSKNIFPLGQKEKALDLLEKWLKDPAEKPEKLKSYTEEDLKKWLRYVMDKEG